MSCSSAPSNFMPSLANAPPATTATRSYTPDETSAPATTSAWIGAAQNALMSHPLASVMPVASAIALPRLPPPRWYRSPIASSPAPITYGIDVGSTPVAASRCRVACTAPALHARFSSSTWAVSDSSDSCAGANAPITSSPWNRGSSPGRGSSFRRTSSN